MFFMPGWARNAMSKRDVKGCQNHENLEKNNQKGVYFAMIRVLYKVCVIIREKGIWTSMIAVLCDYIRGKGRQIKATSLH